MQLSSACKLVGLFNKDLATWSSSTVLLNKLTKMKLKILLRERNIAREKKDFTKSDQIRDLLNNKGIAIEDKWKN
jgi:cysteinyl-tRNA synthetase